MKHNRAGERGLGWFHRGRNPEADLKGECQFTSR